MGNNNEIYLSQKELDDLKKSAKTYKNNKMSYRLTKKDVLMIKENANPNKIQYKLIYDALNEYLIERSNSYIQTSDCLEYLTGALQKIDKQKYADENDAKKFAVNQIICYAISYFYNVPYLQISEIKGIDRDDLYCYISREELDFINRIKKALVDSGKNKPYPSEDFIIRFAEVLGKKARAAFMQAYNVDPLLIQKNEYIDSDIEKIKIHLEKEVLPKLDNEKSSNDGDGEELELD